MTRGALVERRGRRAWAWGLATLLVLATQLSTARHALAHGEMGGGDEQGAMVEPGGKSEREMPKLELQVPGEARLGDTITVRARLTDPHDGAPIPHALVSFEMPAFLGEEFSGPMVIGTAETDGSGMATFTTQLRTSGETSITAEFAGDGAFMPADASAPLDVRGSQQLYSPTAGIRIPGLNLWALAGVIAFVWSLYFLVGLRVLAIARPRDAAFGGDSAQGVSRRDFLGRLIPLGAQAGIAAFGAALVAVVARSPRTHGNLMAPPSTTAYERTPLAYVGGVMEMREMPMPLDREVSFSGEVLPIFLRHGGPHVVLPESSPPPGGLRLDSYEHVMEEEGVVVPGKPEDSEMIEHLLSPGMQMPPSVPPLPDELIQIVVTWIAQGARDN